MTTAEKANEALKNSNNGNGADAKTALAKAKRGGTMLGLKAGDVKSIIEAYKPLIAQALPKHLTAERIIQVATTLISRTPELAECSVESLIGAVMQSSILGLEPTPALGQCYLIPFNNKKTGKREVQFLIGYKGLIDLARRSDKIQTLYAYTVHENDTFSYSLGLDPDLKHIPGEDRGELTHAYAVAKFTNGGYAFEVMPKSEIEKIRQLSQAGSSKYSPWNSGFYDEMARKTVLRKLSKMLPMSVEQQHSIASDEKRIEIDHFDKGELDLNAIPEEKYTPVEDETDGDIKLFNNEDNSK